mgnify:CR=1 FL=1
MPDEKREFSQTVCTFVEELHMSSFGVVLSALMKDRNLSAGKLADKVGYSAKTIQEWLGPNGRMPRDVAAIKKLAEFFNVSTHYLLYGEEDKRSDIASFLAKHEIFTGIYEISIKKVQHREGK